MDGLGFRLTIPVRALYQRFGWIAKSGKNEFSPDGWKHSPIRRRGCNFALESGSSLVLWCASLCRGRANYCYAGSTMADDKRCRRQTAGLQIGSSSARLALLGWNGLHNDRGRFACQRGSIVPEQVHAGYRVGEVRIGLYRDWPLTNGHPTLLSRLLPTIC